MRVASRLSTLLVLGITLANAAPAPDVERRLAIGKGSAKTTKATKPVITSALSKPSATPKTSSSPVHSVSAASSAHAVTSSSVRSSSFPSSAAPSSAVHTSSLSASIPSSLSHSSSSSTSSRGLSSNVPSSSSSLSASSPSSVSQSSGSITVASSSVRSATPSPPSGVLSTSASSSASASAPACSASQLTARAPLTHPPGTQDTHLFHGTNAANAATLMTTAVDLSRGTAVGDFHHRNDVPGGFYMSDSLIAAAQFACYGIITQHPHSVDVVEYQWTAGGQAVYQFPSENAEYNAFIAYNRNPNTGPVTNDPNYATAHKIYAQPGYQMITGPMNGPTDSQLTNSFWQYTVVNAASATNNLHAVARHQNILCDNIPMAGGLTDEMYALSQYGNAAFNMRLAELQDPNYDPSSGCCGCTVH